jgi:hypothetical protein
MTFVFDHFWRHYSHFWIQKLFSGQFRRHQDFKVPRKGHNVEGSYRITNEFLEILRTAILLYVLVNFFSIVFKIRREFLILTAPTVVYSWLFVVVRAVTFSLNFNLTLFVR